MLHISTCASYSLKHHMLCTDGRLDPLQRTVGRFDPLHRCLLASGFRWRAQCGPRVLSDPKSMSMILRWCACLQIRCWSKENRLEQLRNIYIYIYTSGSQCKFMHLGPGPWAWAPTYQRSRWTRSPPSPKGNLWVDIYVWIYVHRIWRNWEIKIPVKTANQYPSIYIYVWQC